MSGQREGVMKTCPQAVSSIWCRIDVWFLWHFWLTFSGRKQKRRFSNMHYGSAYCEDFSMMHTTKNTNIRKSMTPTTHNYFSYVRRPAKIFNLRSCNYQSWRRCTSMKLVRLTKKQSTSSAVSKLLWCDVTYVLHVPPDAKQWLLMSSV